MWPAVFLSGLFKNCYNGRPAEESGSGGHGSVQTLLDPARRFNFTAVWGTSHTSSGGSSGEGCPTPDTIHLAASVIQPQVSS